MITLFNGDILFGECICLELTENNFAFVIIMKMVENKPEDRISSNEVILELERCRQFDLKQKAKTCNGMNYIFPYLRLKYWELK